MLWVYGRYRVRVATLGRPKGRPNLTSTDIADITNITDITGLVEYHTTAMKGQVSPA